MCLAYNTLSVVLQTLWTYYFNLITKLLKDIIWSLKVQSALHILKITYVDIDLHFKFQSHIVLLQSSMQASAYYYKKNIDKRWLLNGICMQWDVYVHYTYADDDPQKNLNPFSKLSKSRKNIKLKRIAHTYTHRKIFRINGNEIQNPIQSTLIFKEMFSSI